MDDVEEEAIFEIVCARDEVEEELYSSSRKVKVVQELDPAQTSLGEFFGLSLGDDAPHGSIGSLDLSDIPSDLIEMVDAPPCEEAEIGIELDSESDDEILNRDRKSVTLVKERTGPFGSDPSPPLAVRRVKRGLRDNAQVEGEVVSSSREGLTPAAGAAPSAGVPAPASMRQGSPPKRGKSSSIPSVRPITAFFQPQTPGRIPFQSPQRLLPQRRGLQFSSSEKEPKKPTE